MSVQMAIVCWLHDSPSSIGKFKQSNSSLLNQYPLRNMASRLHQTAPVNVLLLYLSFITSLVGEGVFDFITFVFPLHSHTVNLHAKLQLLY